MEKRDYLARWIQAHIEDADALGKPVLVQEFGKARPAAKLYAIPGVLMPGESVAPGFDVSYSFKKKNAGPSTIGYVGKGSAVTRQLRSLRLHT